MCVLTKQNSINIRPSRYDTVYFGWISNSLNVRIDGVRNRDLKCEIPANMFPIIEAGLQLKPEDGRTHFKAHTVGKRGNWWLSIVQGNNTYPVYELNKSKLPNWFTM